MTRFSVHFDGPITVDHKVTLRVMAKTYEHMQRCIDRAYLVNRYGDVSKHARLKEHQYEETEFLAEYPRPGGIILDAVRDGADAIIDRVYSAVRPLFERAVAQGIAQTKSLETQVVEVRRYVGAPNDENVRTFDAVAANPPPEWANAYSNRSVVKEVDQLVAQIKPDRVEGSRVDIALAGGRVYPILRFDADVARRFHAQAAKRDLGPPMVITAIIRTLDRGNKQAKASAKIRNVATRREVVLHLASRADFDALHPHHKGENVRLLVCPILEAGGFDLRGGDLMFLRVV